MNAKKVLMVVAKMQNVKIFLVVTTASAKTVSLVMESRVKTLMSVVTKLNNWL